MAEILNYYSRRPSFSAASSIILLLQRPIEVAGGKWCMASSHIGVACYRSQTALRLLNVVAASRCFRSAFIGLIRLVIAAKSNSAWHIHQRKRAISRGVRWLAGIYGEISWWWGDEAIFRYHRSLLTYSEARVMVRGKIAACVAWAQCGPKNRRECIMKCVIFACMACYDQLMKLN